jgi:uncharacterized protein DUF3466/PEP-CTERM motif-containing protein
MMLHRRNRVIGLAALVVAIVASPSRADWIFTNISLGGAAGAGGTTLNGINNNGAVVGFGQDSTLANFTNFAGLPGTPTLLNISGSTNAMANGINSSNEVVGGNNGVAFTLTNNYQTYSTLASVNSTTTSEAAAGINDKGMIVGQYSDSATGLTPGFVYNSGTYTTLTPVNPVAGVLVVNAQGINNNGLVAGFYSTDNTTTPVDGNEPQHGFIYNTVTGHYTLAPDPNQPNFFTVQLLGINDNGIVAGYWQDAAGNQHGLLYNVATQSYSYLDDPNAALVNGITTTQITGINDSGEITGFYINSSGVAEGFVAINSVPEPASIALLGIGMTTLIGVGFVRKRRMQISG